MWEWAKKVAPLPPLTSRRPSILYWSMDCSKNSMYQALEVCSIIWLKKNWKIDNSAKHQFSEELIFRYLGAKDGLSQCSVLSPILFVFILSALFENLSCMKSDFSDDGDTGTQVYLNCQITLKPSEPWSKKWRIAVNGDKTSILYRNSEKTNALKIIGEACQIIKTQLYWVWLLTTNRISTNIYSR